MATSKQLMYHIEHFKSKKEWIPDKARSYCSICTKKFFLGGKYHCRRCGEVVCSSCAPFAPAFLPGLGRTKVRVCQACRVHDEGKDEFLMESSSSSDDEAEEELIKRSEMMLFSPSREAMEKAMMKMRDKLLAEEEDRATTNSSASMDSTSSSSSAKFRGMFGRETSM